MIDTYIFNGFQIKKLSNLMPKLDLRKQITDMRIFLFKK